MNTALKGPLTAGSLDFKNFFLNSTKYLPSFKVVAAATKLSPIVIIVSPPDLTEGVQNIDTKYGLNISQALKSASLKGKSGDTLETYTMNESVPKVYLFITPDLEKEFDIREFQSLGAKISNSLNKHEHESASLEFAGSVGQKDSIIANIYYGLALRNYRFDKYFEAKKESKDAKLKSIEIISNNTSALTKILGEMHAIAAHTMLVRDLVNSPALDINPTTYSKIIADGFAGTAVKVKVLEVSDMEKLGMGALLAVGHGSVNKARTVIMEYMGNPASKDVDFAVIGKGVCFDSGGYSLKPAGSMEEMKMDMAGSAVSFATLKLIATMGLKVNVVGAVGLVENLVDNSAYKPGDVLRSMSSQTIEVLNTDAEGRLVLADLLYYTQKNYNPKFMVDLATLTGAVGICFADVYAGLMYNDFEFASLIEKTGTETGEISWKLPFRKEYDEMINSSLADIKNTGGRGAGTITAGQFLKRFVNFEKGMEAKWAHLDIAYTAFDGKGGADPKVSKGATGWGVNLIYTLIKNNFSK